MKLNGFKQVYRSLNHIPFEPDYLDVYLPYSLRHSFFSNLMVNIE